MFSNRENGLIPGTSAKLYVAFAQAVTCSHHFIPAPTPAFAANFPSHLKGLVASQTNLLSLPGMSLEETLQPKSHILDCRHLV